MPSNFKFDNYKGFPVKVCVHCGEYVSLGASGREQMQFTMSHVVKHSKGPVFVEQKPNVNKG